MKSESVVSVVTTIAALIVLVFLLGVGDAAHLLAVLISAALPIILSISLYVLVRKYSTEVAWNVFKNRITYYLGTVLVTVFLFIWVLDEYFRVYVLIIDIVVIGGMLVFVLLREYVKKW